MFFSSMMEVPKIPTPAELKKLNKADLIAIIRQQQDFIEANFIEEVIEESISPAFPVSWWRLNEQTGQTIYEVIHDLQGNAIDTSLIRLEKWGKFLSFPGNAHVEIPHSPYFNFGTGDFSLSVWIQTESHSDLQVILDKRVETSGAVCGYCLYLYRGNLGLQIADGEGKQHTNYNSDAKVSDGKVHFIAVTVDRDRKEGILWYVDGQLIGKIFNPTGRQGSLDNTKPLCLGRRSDHPGWPGFFQGNLADLRLYDRVLTPEEIEDLQQQRQNYPSAIAPSNAIINYEQIQKFLAEGDWSQADRETHQLMLKVSGRERSQWLETEDIATFPREILQQLDQLWLDASGGRFGMSVQLKLWLETGNQPGQYDEEAYKKFGAKVGWYSQDLQEWRGRDRLTLTLNDPVGAFPLGWISVISFNYRSPHGTGSYGCDWYSRLHGCKLFSNISPQPAPLLPAIDYRPLRNALAQGNWQAADRETGCILLDICNRSQQQKLDRENVTVFPCDSLKIIDEMWVKYSQGRFGYSVQARIWQEVREELGRDDEAAFEVLGDRVGWRETEESEQRNLSEGWLDAKKLTFSLDAPVGHLPVSMRNNPIPSYTNRGRLKINRKTKERSYLGPRLLVLWFARVEECLFSMNNEQ
jgi:hypothetical protein